MRRFLWVQSALLVAGVLLAGPASAQILNTLRGFDGAERGLSGELAALFSASGGNTENVSITATGTLQWQGDVHRWRLLLEAARAESRQETTEEATAIHVRHNAKLAAGLASLAFIQHQHDRFQRLDTRFLFGAGVRWDFLRAERIEGSWGLSPMLEVERIEDRDFEARGRMSSFVSVLGRIGERTSVDVTTFYQPAIDELADARAVAMSSIRVGISGNLSLLLGFRFQYDAKPAPDVKKEDWKTRTGLSLAL